MRQPGSRDVMSAVVAVGRDVAELRQQVAQL